MRKSLIKGDEAYQVWLIKDGIRHNAGTLRADHQGNGVLTYRLNGDDKAFDAIGITLEPDSHGTRPRGKKVLGT
ncbi:anti-sigma factor [Ferviditalea candida]|uniref:Anti-sigma factor n=1 Tax=Ferviditalea candida TaxID=3108399 RepID=A0ABU5ZDK8_9BACL|nr:anti-sigma factor [Paenibacillaceae bacterium T2]